MHGMSSPRVRPRHERKSDRRNLGYFLIFGGSLGVVLLEIAALIRL